MHLGNEGKDCKFKCIEIQLAVHILILNSIHPYTFTLVYTRIFIYKCFDADGDGDGDSMSVPDSTSNGFKLRCIHARLRSPQINVALVN